MPEQHGSSRAGLKTGCLAQVDRQTDFPGIKAGSQCLILGVEVDQLRHFHRNVPVAMPTVVNMFDVGPLPENVGDQVLDNWQ